MQSHYKSSETSLVNNKKQMIKFGYFLFISEDIV